MADLVVTPANVKGGAGSNSLLGNSGATINAGDLVAKNSGGDVVLCDANGASPIDTPVGVALNSCPGVGQPIRYAPIAPALEGFTTTQGVVYVASANAGKIAAVTDLASGWTVSILGVGKAANKLDFYLFASGVSVP